MVTQIGGFGGSDRGEFGGSDRAMWWLRWEYVIPWWLRWGWLTYGDVVTQIGEFGDSDRRELGGSDRENVVAQIVFKLETEIQFPLGNARNARSLTG